MTSSIRRLVPSEEHGQKQEGSIELQDLVVACSWICQHVVHDLSSKINQILIVGEVLPL